MTRDNDNLYEQVSNNLKYHLSMKEVNLQFNLNGGKIQKGETGTVVREYDGFSKFDEMIENPVRDGYEFVGWTKTKNGTDYVDSYDYNENTEFYASWIYVEQCSGLSIIEIEDSSYKGIKILIVNPPENHYRRTFYINGKEVGGDAMKVDEDTRLNPKYGKIWAYPFTEKGNIYEVSVSYSKFDYGFLKKSKPVKIRAKSGLGEFKLLNKPEFEIKDNVLRWKTAPRIQIGSESPKKDDNWNEYYLIEVESNTPYSYQSWNHLGASCETDFDFKAHVKEDVLNGEKKDLQFRLRYIYNLLPTGDLCLVIYDFDDVPYFNLQ